MNYEALLSFAVLLLLIARTIYWKLTEIKADTDKPKSIKGTLRGKVIKGFTTFFGILMTLQLLGLPLFTFELSLLGKLFGFLLVLIGMYFSFYGRYELGTNWAHAADFQIKKEHKLVTTGIYRYVRNPIYTGIFLASLGTEIVVGSYLFLIALLILPAFCYVQAKKEEEILRKHFGKPYDEYLKRSKMFFPFVW